MLLYEYARALHGDSLVRPAASEKVPSPFLESNLYLCITESLRGWSPSAYGGPARCDPTPRHGTDSRTHELMDSASRTHGLRLPSRTQKPRAAREGAQPIPR